ncbi:MAG: hypothetical protein PHV78_00620 [Patescibacteria group bacterium]|nr:hypothetical protein [Patescibacteria group bacterium]MDD5121324.1 hypothetical protein [Patescibacteria group bacterium]MDD5221809.1 hypothetical protein [Patescibacteria group bacterium]MDD5395757.1 hypothetical protein [Patescibacteria group bacterium]
MKKVLIATALTAMVVAPLIVMALPPMNEGLEQFETQTELSNADLTVVIARIVRLVLGFLGLIAVVIIIIGGFQWMTSGGNEEKIGGAKKLMGAGVIGLFIIVIAYAASLFIMNAITRIVDTNTQH